MIRNYIKIAFRNITKNKIYSFINITGLAIGIASCIIIASFIQSELSYDTFHEKGDNICRVNLYGKIGDNEFNVANSPTPLAAALQEEFPEVVNTVRIERVPDTFLKHKNDLFKEDNFFYADSTLFEIFTINLSEGNTKLALASPNQVVITKKMASKYFGTNNPIGEFLIKDDGTEFLVTGVVEELPHNSHFHYDFIASLSTIESDLGEMWISNTVYTYVLLSEGSSAEALENKLPQMVESRVGPQIEELMGLSFDDFNKSGNSIKFYVQPLKDIHLLSKTYANIEPSGNLESIYIFSAIAIVILLLACVNFVNLTTARSSRRSTEVGIRKVLGSYKTRLIKQFLSESLLITFASLVVAIGFVELLLPIFNEIAGKEISVEYFGNLVVIPILLGLTILVGLLSGSYPALLLSSFQPVAVLKGKNSGGVKGGGLFRGVVVVFQFAITIALLASTFIIRNQLEYVSNKNLGYNGNQILVIPIIDELGNQKEVFKSEILENPSISKATLTSALPNRRLSATIFQKGNAEDNQNYAFSYANVDYDFLDTYEIELKEGRFFSNKFSTDTNAILINETAVAELGFENPLNESLNIPDETNGMNNLKIIGVLKDFHMENLREQIRPLVIVLGKEKDARFLSLKINHENISETVSDVEEQWAKFVPGKVFEYQFMDNDFNIYYMEEQRTGKLFGSFTILAIFIASLGLLGLISFSVEQRTKEIGIRKVLGASTPTILMLLSKEFIKWLVIANIIAIPLVYYFMNEWLQNFAYRENISFTVFGIAGLLSFTLALLTVAFHSIKAALSNPVKSLKYE